MYHTTLVVNNSGKISLQMPWIGKFQQQQQQQHLHDYNYLLSIAKGT